MMGWIFVYVSGLIFIPLAAGFGEGAGWWKVNVNSLFWAILTVVLWPVIAVMALVFACITIPIIGAVALGKWVFDSDEEEGE